jgi:hypothetical protein
LDQRFGELLLHGLHEFIYEFHVRFAFKPWFWIAQVQHIIPQLLVVRAHIQHHR